jgi:hypothetical protein
MEYSSGLRINFMFVHINIFLHFGVESLDGTVYWERFVGRGEYCSVDVDVVEQD